MFMTLTKLGDFCPLNSSALFTYNHTTPYNKHTKKKVSRHTSTPAVIDIENSMDTQKQMNRNSDYSKVVDEEEDVPLPGRGRKYRNSIRPNRVTGSGFWKATGIDRPIYSGEGSVCIGLKKSLVYYRGSAGKGTKTEWMMHEFRLPPHSDNQQDDKSIAISQEAEVWTLCRILKRSPCYKRTLPEWREVTTRKSPPVVDTSSGDSDHDMQSYISFQAPVINDNKPFAHNHHHQHRHGTNQLITGQVTRSTLTSEPPSTTGSCSSFSGLDVNEFIKHGDWEDLRAVVNQFSTTDPFLFM
ncbi:hypothetical protein L1887_25641 [Cichorium endivia]|nr:hypothetical protein L1887_25641 [Cichorium endivia]